MNRRWYRVLFLAGTCFVLMAGCDSENGSDRRLLPQGDFPSVQGWWDLHNGHNDDALAFSPLGQDVDNPEGVRYFANGGRPGTGLVLFTSEPNGDLDGEGDTDEILWASFHDCGSFTPPVEIFGENQDDEAHVNLGDVSVLWIEGREFANRDGDALILYRRRSTGRPDVDGDGDVIDTGNMRLYSCYFDRSESNTATGEAPDGSTLIYGFSSLATFVDADPGGSDDSFDADVETSGLVSDGLQFSHRYDRGNNPATASGDDVSFVCALWTQVADPDDESFVGRRVWYSEFDLAGNSTRFPAPATLSPEASTLATADGGLADDDFVQNPLYVHNGLVLWEIDQASTNRVLQASVFDVSGPSAPQAVSRSDADGVFPSEQSANNLYGDDHGLSHFWFAFAEEGFDDGNFSSERDVMVSIVDLDGSGSETAEVDAFIGDADEPAIRPGSLRTRISRTGEHIWFAWIQVHQTEGEENPAEDPTPSGFTRVVDVSELVLGIDAATSGDLGTSGTATRLNSDVRTGPDRGVVVTDLEFQAKLATGQSDPERSFQADPDRVHFLFRQEDRDFSGTDDEALDRIELHYTPVDVDPNDVNAVSGGTSSDTLVDTIDESWSFSHLRPRNDAPDAFFGLDGPSPGGTAVACDTSEGLAVIYVSQGNNKDDNTPDSPGVTIFQESRLYVSLDGGTPSEISSDGSSFGTNTTSPDFFQVEGFQVVCTPCDDDVTRNPGWAGRFVHIFIGELHSNDDPVVLRHRVWDTQSTAIGLGDQFDPPLDLNGSNRSQTPPVRIDGGLPNDVNDLAVVCDGTSIDAYMEIDGHIYYNEWRNNSWRTDGGLSDPALVDHDTTVAITRHPFFFEGGDLAQWYVFEPQGRRDCPTRSCTVVAWVKRDLEAFGTETGFARLQGFLPPEENTFAPDRLSVRVRR